MANTQNTTFCMIYEAGADDRIRTGDLLLTKQLLYQLSYIGKICKTVRIYSI